MRILATTLLKKSSAYPFAVVLFLLTILTPVLSFKPVDPSNPLEYQFNKNIDFPAITPEHIKSITDQSIVFSKTELQKIYAIPAAKRTFQNTMVALDDITNRVNSSISPFAFLKNVTTSKEIIATADKSIQEISAYLNEVSQDEQLFRSVKEYAATKEAKTLTGYKKKYLSESIRDFERSGLSLSKEKRDELRALKDKITQLSIAFSNNIAAHQDSLMVTEKEIEGLPESYKQARKRSDGKYKIDLTSPSYTPFMENALSEDARKALYKKYNNRASATNVPVLKEILANRKKMAQLLGYKTFAEYQTQIRMVKSPSTVWSFENNLIDKVKVKAQQDYNELLQAKKEHLHDNTIAKVQPWESAFYKNILLKTKYNLDREKLKEYFELNNVMNGLFTVSQQLYSVQFREVQNAKVWYPGVKMFEVLDNNKVIGKFYLDLHPRKDKFTHAACFAITKGKKTPAGYQIPVAALVCNFTAPTKDQPALMSLQEVTTFFHEFGHVLHNMFSRSELSDFSGTSVARDFVEAPSQIYQNWVYDYGVLKLFAKHYKTGEVLPQAMYDKMVATKNVGSGLNTLTQIFYGVYDMTLHDKFDPSGTETTTDVVRKVQNETSLFPYVEDTHFEAAFGHLTGYAAGYYGYLWAEVYAEDMFSVFKKNGMLNKETGKRYRDIVLSRGGDEDPLELVKKFLGREPNQEAFLKSLGLN